MENSGFKVVSSESCPREDKIGLTKLCRETELRLSPSLAVAQRTAQSAHEISLSCARTATTPVLARTASMRRMPR